MAVDKKGNLLFAGTLLSPEGNDHIAIAEIVSIGEFPERSDQMLVRISYLKKIEKFIDTNGQDFFLPVSTFKESGWTEYKVPDYSQLLQGMSEEDFYQLCEDVFRKNCALTKEVYKLLHDEGVVFDEGYLKNKDLFSEALRKEIERRK